MVMLDMGKEFQNTLSRHCQRYYAESYWKKKIGAAMKWGIYLTNYSLTWTPVLQRNHLVVALRLSFSKSAQIFTLQMQETAVHSLPCTLQILFQKQRQHK